MKSCCGKNIFHPELLVTALLYIYFTSQVYESITFGLKILLVIPDLKSSSARGQAKKFTLCAVFSATIFKTPQKPPFSSQRAKIWHKCCSVIDNKVFKFLAHYLLHEWHNSFMQEKSLIRSPSTTKYQLCSSKFFSIAMPRSFLAVFSHLADTFLDYSTLSLQKLFDITVCLIHRGKNLISKAR